MGKLMDKLKQACPNCLEMQIPRRLAGRFLDVNNERIYLLHCNLCLHYWKDPSIKSKSRSVFTDS